jgi:hypothetical protein
MLDFAGTFRTRIPTYVWEGQDRNGAKLIAKWTPASAYGEVIPFDGESPEHSASSNWDVTTYAKGDEISVTSVHGLPKIKDTTEMFRAASKMMRDRGALTHPRVWP